MVKKLSDSEKCIVGRVYQYLSKRRNREKLNRENMENPERLAEFVSKMVGVCLNSVKSVVKNQLESKTGMFKKCIHFTSGGRGDRGEPHFKERGIMYELSI